MSLPAEHPRNEKLRKPRKSRKIANLGSTAGLWEATSIVNIMSRFVRKLSNFWIHYWKTEDLSFSWFPEMADVTIIPQTKYS